MKQLFFSLFSFAFFVSLYGESKDDSLLEKKEETYTEFCSFDEQISAYFQKRNIPDQTSKYSIPRIREIGADLVELTNQWAQGRFNEEKTHSTLGNKPLKQLEKTGYYELGQLFSKEQVEDICYFLNQEPVYKGHVFSCRTSDTPYSLNTIPGKLATYNENSIMRCPHLLELATSPEVYSIAEDYLGCTPTLWDLNVLYTFDNPKAKISHSTQSFHRDLDTRFRQIVFMVYLSDVGIDSGPHVYQESSQNGKKPRRNHVFLGKAGTGFVEDPLGLHRGSNPKNGKHRLIFWFRYGIGCNYTYQPDKNYSLFNKVGLEEKSLVNRMNIDSKKKKFSFRYFLSKEFLNSQL